MRRKTWLGAGLGVALIASTLMAPSAAAHTRKANGERVSRRHIRMHRLQKQQQAAAAAAAATAAAPAAATTAAAEPPHTGPGFLAGPGEWGKLEFVSKLQLTDTDDTIADVGVDPSGDYAYVAHWGEPDCAANSEAGGVNDPDAGIYVVDIRDIENPELVEFIPHSQDSRPGEGVQAVEISTSFFTGTMLITNNEQCGPQGKGGVSLYDVTDPTKPKKLSEHFGDRGFADFNEIHSSFAWDAGDNAYVVMTDNVEATDVDILDITNPHRPRLIADLNLNEYCRPAIGALDQPEIGLQESSLHDMIVKFIDGRWIMLLSYWDGGFVALDVTDPANPVCLDDTDYTNPDPELLESTGIAQWPEGNAHQAEFTIDNRFFIGTDEDFSPYRANFEISTGPNAGPYPAGEFGWTVPLATQDDPIINGPTVYGGFGCPADRASIPLATDVFPTVDPGEERIIVFQRGPVEAACFFSEKVESAQLAGYDAVIVANHHVGAQGGAAPDAYICGSQGHAFEPTIPGFCIGHRAMHLLFNTAPAYGDGPEPAIGTVGQEVTIAAEFDGWGYVHLFDAETMEELDTYAIPEAHDEDFAFGFGEFTVHEVAVDPQDPTLAYISYYSGGMRVVQIQCSNPADTSTCELVEVGGYLDPMGNDFWGVEAFVGDDGQTYVLGSDMDFGLWIFRDP